jgi:hypothetical protein
MSILTPILSPILSSSLTSVVKQKVFIFTVKTVIIRMGL